MQKLNLKVSKLKKKVINENRKECMQNYLLSLNVPLIKTNISAYSDDPAVYLKQALSYILTGSYTGTPVSAEYDNQTVDGVLQAGLQYFASKVDEDPTEKNAGLFLFARFEYSTQFSIHFFIYDMFISNRF